LQGASYDAILDFFTKAANDPRVTIRRAGLPDPDGTCVVYWMQRAQRALDNPALNVAVDLANALSKPAVVFFAPVPFYPHANLRHYRFLNQAIPGIASGLSRKNIGLVLRRFPDHSLLRFCEEVRPALVIGDENPLREPESWRRKATSKLKIPFWTVDADLIVPSKLFDKAQYSARIIRPKLRAQLKRFLVSPRNPVAHIGWKKPRSLSVLPIDSDVTAGWPLDRSVSPVASCRGGTNEGRRLLRDFVENKLPGYAAERNKPELDRTAACRPTCISVTSAQLLWRSP
jgi:deoxyribodipyrimidine photo-lyase